MRDGRICAPTAGGRRLPGGGIARTDIGGVTGSNASGSVRALRVERDRQCTKRWACESPKRSGSRDRRAGRHRKSSVSRRLARAGRTLSDKCIGSTLAVLRAGADPTDIAAVDDCVDGADVVRPHPDGDSCYLAEEDKEIRGDAVTRAVSAAPSVPGRMHLAGRAAANNG